jgi:HPt (histidine-containing phosphotransfer) domain-containing protein
MIDWGQVRELHREIGQQCFAEVQDMFFDEVGIIVSRLRNTPDSATLGADLHALKGSVVTLGFVELARLCQQGEVQVTHGDASRVDIDAILAAYEQSKLQFIAQRDQHLVADPVTHSAG